MFHFGRMTHDGSPDSSLAPGLRWRARGAASNVAGRFEPARRETRDDGWDLPQEARLLRTETRIERPRSAIVRNTSPDLGFEQSINPYRGCEHGCIYCYARPSHAYLNLSPGLDFETRLIARPGIGAVLERELRAPRYRPAAIAIGTNTDPYQPLEGEMRVMREILEVLRDFNHPVGITTRGTLIERDLDILGPMAAKGLVRVGISVTTLDAGLARRMEPRAPAPARRLQVIRRLTEAGVPVRLMLAPVIPGLTDPEIETVMKAAHDAGAVAASWILLRLPREVEPLFRDWLDRHMPDRKAKILARLTELHDGQTYDAGFGRRMRGQGIWADLISRRFHLARDRLGMSGRQASLRVDLFRVPPAPGDQLSLL